MRDRRKQRVVWVCFLHLYQPANQAEDIFKRVVNESYRPLVRHILDNSGIKITLNISGALTEQLIYNGGEDVVKGLRQGLERGQIEFTDSAKYHALLPFLPEDETIRQIKLNRETNQKYFGPLYKPVGFFPPEMAFSHNLPSILERLGYKWLIVDEIALGGKISQIDTHAVYTISGSRVLAFFRDRIHSNLIMSALIRRIEDFKGIKDFFEKGYLVTGMDGETFGHHRPGLDKLLVDLLKSKDLEHAFFSEIEGLFPARKEAVLVDSTWASTEKDIENNVQFLTWRDPDNAIHTRQWELQKLALDSVEKFRDDDPNIVEARRKLDAALSSDHFFWASARPWWSLEVVEAGAWSLLDVIQSVPEVSPDVVNKAKELYHKIIAKTFEWQRTGYIKKIYAEYREVPRVPFKERTEGAGEPWVYKAFVEFMKREMRGAAEKENFEEATMWRDALWKLETKNDIYDAVHAVDILRKRLNEPEVYGMIERYRKEYEKVVSGQPEPRGT